MFLYYIDLVGICLEHKDWEYIKKTKMEMTLQIAIAKVSYTKVKKIILPPPFTKCDCVEDYKGTWVHIEEWFKEKKIWK